MEVLEKIKAELQSFEEKKQAFLVELRTQFSPMLKPLFEANTKITSIGWTQYTPHFNDGEDCEFGVNQSDLYVNGVMEDDLSELCKGKYGTITAENKAEHERFNSTDMGYKWYIDKPVGDGGYFSNEKYDTELAKGVADFKKALSEVPEDFYKDLFGDHVKVTVTSEGEITTDEYEHD